MKTFLKFSTAAAICLVAVNPAIALPGKKATTAAKPAATQAKGKTANPARLGGKPNLNGIWFASPRINWNVEAHDSGKNPSFEAERATGAIGAIPAGLGVVEGGSIQYKPEALKKRDDNRSKAPRYDPEASCYLPGVPRASYISPFQIIQGEKGDLLFANEYHSANRIIYMKPVEVPPIETWMGTSYGAWEGDTLKVTTLSQNPGDVIGPGGETYPGVTWLDRSGNFLGNNATVTERFTLIDKDHIAYTATIDDPDNYAKPIKMSFTLYRDMDPNAQLMEFNCVPFAEEMIYREIKLPNQGQAPAQK